MTHEVIIEYAREDDAREARLWCMEQGWQHLVDWRWFKPDYFKQQMYFIFQFDDPAKANWFALRWSS